ncbi:MAG: hypothetical protein JXA15_11995 [Spirochaetales bacterium]|nr:hypothetical protein [Spirochaetales bacterium]
MERRELWTQAERELLDFVKLRLDREGRNGDLEALGDNLEALRLQADALALYPGITEWSRISGSGRNVDTLVAALGERYHDDDVFVMPTKALLGRTFELSRINLLALVRRLFGPSDAAQESRVAVESAMLSRLLAVMTEDVLLEILGDAQDRELRMRAAHVLARIWDRRLEAVGHPFIPELATMWLMRRDLIPVFGTLLGTQEYITLYLTVDAVCQEYIERAAGDPGEAAALEEFLFGLPYEELERVKLYLEHTGTASIGLSDIKRVLGKESIYLSDRGEDPLELYRFYNYRRKRAARRKHGGGPGPIRTFEENFMRFLLGRNGEGAAGA